VNAGLLEVGDINTPTATLGGSVQVDAGGTLRGHQHGTRIGEAGQYPGWISVLSIASEPQADCPVLRVDEIDRSGDRLAPHACEPGLLLTR
jgi:hypothetical protein